MIFMIFCTFWRLKCAKLTKSRAPKMQKMPVLEYLDSLKLISRKIWVTENPEISTLCGYVLWQKSEQAFENDQTQNLDNFGITNFFFEKGLFKFGSQLKTRNSIWTNNHQVLGEEISRSYWKQLCYDRYLSGNFGIGGSTNLLSNIVFSNLPFLLNIP